MRVIFLTICISFFYACHTNNQQKEAAIEVEQSDIAAIPETELDETGEDEHPDLKVPDNYKDCLQEVQDEFVPEGFCEQAKIEGDFNNDGLMDYILVVQATEESGWQHNQWETEIVNKNRQGVIMVMNEGERYCVHSQNLSLLDSNNEDGGVYYAPELDISVNKKGLIAFNYSHGRYGYWQYLFRLQDDKFELIGYEGHSDRGPIPLYIYSYNFSTMRKKISENVLADKEMPNDEYDEKWVDEWSDIKMKKRISLTEIENLTDLFAKFE